MDLHTLGEDETQQTPQQRQAAELIDAAKEVFAFSGVRLVIQYPLIAFTSLVCQSQCHA